jgi:hypothetical protein
LQDPVKLRDLRIRRCVRTLDIIGLAGDEMKVQNSEKTVEAMKVLQRSLESSPDKALAFEWLNDLRQEPGEPSFDTVRALFPESHALCESSGFREKTHIQICVRNPEMIKGVFRVPRHHFSSK